MTKKIFLLIDDDEDDRELFQLALNDVDTPAECHCCPDCEDGLKKLEQIKPDYIFLDLNMPQMSGRECLEVLKEAAHLKDIPVIIFSTSSDPGDIAETKELGAVGFITKPSKTSELTSILDNFIVTQHRSPLKSKT